jgi:ribosomal protein S18 acetylase RimI-like enzyme
MDAPKIPERGPAPGPLALTIRELTPHDGLRIDRSAAFQIAGWSWYTLEDEGLYQEELIGLPRWPNSSVLLAMLGDWRVGFLELRETPVAATILALVVDPAYRHRGVATRLVDHVRRSRYQRDPTLPIEAFASERNGPGQSFYRSLAFKGRRCRKAPLVRYAFPR